MKPTAHTAFCERAIAEAQRSPLEHKLGAVIVKDNKVVAAGFNQYTVNHYRHAWSVHAEVAAIMQLRGKPPSYLRECEMYVVRIGRRHSCPTHPLRLSKPCANCEALIRERGIRRVYYSVNEDVPVNNGKPRVKAGTRLQSGVARVLATCPTMRLPK